VQVDATEESALGSRFDVSGYPTIKVRRRPAVALGRLLRHISAARCIRAGSRLQPHPCTLAGPARRAARRQRAGCGVRPACRRRKGLLGAAQRSRDALSLLTITASQLFRNGKASEYNGPRQAAGIVNYMMCVSTGVGVGCVAAALTLPSLAPAATRRLPARAR